MKISILICIAFLLTGCIAGKYIIYPPVEHGSLASFEGKKPKIILGKFTAYQVKNDNWRPSTQYYESNYISNIIYLRIKDNCEIIYPDTNNNFFRDTSSIASRSLSVIANGIVFSMLSNPDSLQYWKCSTPIQDIDSNTYFYLPVLLENMSGDDYNPKFYTLIINNKGTIVYSQMIHKYFKPGMWAKDYMQFEGDTRGIMPLSK
jgi:hypothetical protein